VEGIPRLVSPVLEERRVMKPTGDGEFRKALRRNAAMAETPWLLRDRCPACDYVSQPRNFVRRSIWYCPRCQVVPMRVERILAADA
jgi:hypothetical protein